MERPARAALQRLELHLPQSPSLHRPGARVDELHQLLPAPAPRQGPQEHAASHLHPGARTDLAVSLLHPGGHRHPADVLLRALHHAGLRPHARSARHRRLRHLSAQHAPLERARHGGHGLPAHVPRLPNRRLQEAARVQLGARRHPPVGHALHELHRLPAALGPAGLLGHHRRQLASPATHR